MTGWLGLLLLAAPPMVVQADLGSRDAIAKEASGTWDALASKYGRVAQVKVPSVTTPLRIVRGRALRGHQSGRSTLGRVTLRVGRTGRFTPKLRTTLRHEVAHQFLLHVCPAAAHDRLFHEAFAISVSGELPAWLEDGYLSTPEALKTLQKNPSLEHAPARRAIARLIAEGTRDGSVWPRPIVRRLKGCGAQVRWTSAMTPLELARGFHFRAEDTFLLMDRETGRVLRTKGRVNAKMPFGSTLKPFVVAGHARPPTLQAHPDWRCTEGPPRRMTAAQALLLSCNPYFLAWAEQAPKVARFGRVQSLLTAHGLTVPEDMPEAIGLRPTLSLSPRGMAEAYRQLADRHPEVIRILARNVLEGTLAGLPVSSRLDGATKTGTVRDAASTPILGWIVFVDSSLVAVMTRRGRAPRTFADELADGLRK